MDRYFIVGERPVKRIRTADGGMDVQAFDWKTGGFVRALDYLPRLVLLGDEVREVNQAEFDRVVRELAAKISR